MPRKVKNTMSDRIVPTVAATPSSSQDFFLLSLKRAVSSRASSE
jgi:hypothetical protein